MVVLHHTSDKTVYGPNGQQVDRLIARLSAIDWFVNVGQQSNQDEQAKNIVEKAICEFTSHLDIEGFHINWLTKDQLPACLEGLYLAKSPLWSQIEIIPQKIKELAEKQGRSASLTKVIDNVPALLFHRSFDGAFREFSAYGATVVNSAVGAVMYVFGLACAWELLADLEGWEVNPFLPLIEACEQGHWPLGLFEDQFYVV